MLGRGGVSRLQGVQVEDLVGPYIWDQVCEGTTGVWGLDILSVCRDMRTASPVGRPSPPTVHLGGGTVSVVLRVRQEVVLLLVVGRWRWGWRLSPGYTCPLLQGQELRLPPQSTLLSILL